MRRRITFLLMVIYLVGATESYQLLKLPAFVVHYIQHKEQDPGLCLFSFLKQHYAETQIFDADWQQDMQLPFKVQDDNLSMSGLWNTPTAASIILHPAACESIDHPHKLSDQFMAGRYSPEVFQPPRIFS